MQTLTIACYELGATSLLEPLSFAAQITPAGMVLLDQRDPLGTCKCREAWRSDRDAVHERPGSFDSRNARSG